MDAHTRRKYLLKWRKENAREIEKILRFIQRKPVFVFAFVNNNGEHEYRKHKLEALGQRLTASQWRQFLHEHGVVDTTA